MWILSILSCLLVLFTGSLSSEVCPPSDTESVLLPGYEYTYRFSSEAIAAAVGTTNDKGKISIQCDVVLFHTTDCFYSLRLRDCTVSADGGPPGAEVAWIEDQPLSDLSKYPVLFALANGEVTEVYTDENDPIQFINIKRGALSAFVFKLSYTTRAKEELHTDVHGTCPLTSTPLDTSKGLVRTTKNMLQCAFPSRKDWQFGPYSMFWNMSFIQYIINSTTDCDYTIDVTEKRLDKVYCKEQHAVMLLSTSNTELSVQSNIHYNMEFFNRNPVTRMEDFSSLTRKTDIRYEYERTPDPTSNPENFLPVAKKLLAELVEHSAEEIRLLSIPYFTDFVAWMRSAKDLIPFLNAIKSCSYLSEKECTPLRKALGISYIKDALIQCNSIACFEAVSHLVKTKDISGEFLNYYAWGNMHFSKPTIIKYIMSICHSTDSDLCWASLGSLIQRIYLTYPDLARKDHMLLKDVAKNFHDNIGRLCVSADQNSKTFTLLLRNLKTVRNMGETYLQLIPEGFEQLTECVFKSSVPDSARTFALETFRVVSRCNDEESCGKVYFRLLPLFQNTSESTALRALSYEHLTSLPQRYGFETEVFAVLKGDQNLQLKFYLASNLKSLFKDPHFLKKEGKFIKSMNQLLKDNDLSLNEILKNAEAKSFSKSNSFSFSIPFMPEEMKHFGLKVINSQIYELSDVIPRYFNHEISFEVFSKLIKAFQLRGYSEGLEKVALVFQRLVKDFNSEMPSYEQLLSALQEALKEFKLEDSDETEEYNFQESILKNIRRLEQMYRTFKPKSKSFISSFSDLFGSTVGYFSSGNTASLSKLLEIQALLEDLESGLVYNSTRVLRIIEAYHQVPTMMGLPLNFTTNGTLAFSWRSGLKLNFNRGEFAIHSEGFTQPSAALTFVNRMVIDFPTVTQIGIQANNSAYTSTQWKAKLDYSKNKTMLSIIKPLKSQKILELFRTNQLIKHDTYEDIEDWDIERTSSSHCTDDRVSSLLGLQACLSKSYPVVTSLVKPWALMAGWCKWQLVINPFDEKLEAYNLETVQSSDFRSRELIVKFSTSGSENKREIFLKANVDESRDETKLLMEVPELPDFGISYIQNSPLEHKERRHSTILTFKLEKGHEYCLIFNEEERLDKIGMISGNTDQPPEEQNALVHEYLLSLDTPYNSYRFSEENHKHGEDEKTKVLLSYENLNSSRKWLHTILPETFWENEKKAWVQLQINWKGEKISQAVGRRTVCFIKDPKTVIDLNANSFEMDEREQININLTKTEILTGKLLTFANYTYELWRSQLNQSDDKEIRTYSLTIDRKSWAVEIQRILGDKTFEYEIALKRATMTPKIKASDNSVGWWNNEGSQLYRSDEKELKIAFKLEKGRKSGEELTEKHPVLKNEVPEDFDHSLIDVTIKFYYPLASRQESLTLVGFLLISDGYRKLRIQNDFVAESSYNNLQFTSHGVFQMFKDLTSLHYKSYFKHLPTEAEVHQVLDASFHSDGCFGALLKHKIDSEFIDVSTNVSYDCNSNGKKTHTLLLHLLSNSSYWDMLNLEINQIIEDLNPDYTYETCNFTHPSLLINVTADWTGSPRDHKKRVLFTCRKENCQSTELLLKFLKNGKKSSKLIMPNDENKKLLIEKITSSNGKKLNFRINYSDEEDDDTKDLQLKGEILDENYHIWNLKLNVDTYKRLKSLLENAYQGMLNSFTRMAKDPYHPVNKLMKPSLKVPLYDYVQNLRKQVGELMLVTLENLEETFKSLRPFYEAPLILATNIAFTGKEIVCRAYNSIKDKSILIWAFHYFELPKFFNYTTTDLQNSIPDLFESLIPDDRIIRLEFVTGKILRMRNFYLLPSFSLHKLKLSLFPSKDKEVQPRYRPSKRSKIAMIFGPLHVYTFDGKVYDSAEYSSDCTFLLAHDLRKSSFTVLSDKSTIHILFPEMVVSVNGEKHEVFVNGSSVPSTLPIEAHNGKVVVRRSEVVETWSPSLRVVCSFEDFLCVLELDALHSGATFGLLGNADGSSRNEFSLPEGNTTFDSLKFVSSYEVSGKPECQNLKLSPKPAYSHEAFHTCIDQFNDLCQFDDSPIQAFREACELDIEKDKECHASSGYSALCFYKNLKKGTTHCFGAIQESKKVGRKLRVVFIVHEHHSLAGTEKKSSPYKGMERVLTGINEKFKANGYSDVSFSLIGFGGKGVRYQPTVHAKKSFWEPLKILLDDLLETLQFEGEKEVNVLDVLKYAVEVMGYDTFHSKIFITLTSKDKQGKNKKAIGELQQQLERNGITLYTFSSYPSIEKGTEVFGVRADGHIFPSPKKNGTAFVDYPKGDLAKLTAATRGSVFLTRFVLSNSPASFFREVANEIWAKIRNEAEACRECSTVGSSWWWQVHECSIVHC